jgi:hypothetical protein
MVRERLPNRRAALTFDIEPAGLRYTATLGFYADGRLGEVFINGLKVGSAADTAARESAITASLALQHHVPIEVLRHALLRDARARPSGPLGIVLDLLAKE